MALLPWKESLRKVRAFEYPNANTILGINEVDWDMLSRESKISSIQKCKNDRAKVCFSDGEHTQMCYIPTYCIDMGGYR